MHCDVTVSPAVLSVSLRESVLIVMVRCAVIGWSSIALTVCVDCRRRSVPSRGRGCTWVRAENDTEDGWCSLRPTWPLVSPPWLATGTPRRWWFQSTKIWTDLCAQCGYSLTSSQFLLLWWNAIENDIWNLKCETKTLKNKQHCNSRWTWSCCCNCDNRKWCNVPVSATDLLVYTT